MPNSQSARKRMRQSEKRSEHNRAQRSRLRTALKRVMTATEPEQAQSAFRETVAILDRYASRRLLHPNKAARKKAQLAKHVAALGGEV